MRKRQIQIFSLILSFGVVVISGCPGARKDPQNTITPRRVNRLVYPALTMTHENSVNVEGLAYNKATGGGSMIPATIRVSPNSDNDTNIGVSGNMSGGLGDQWRAAVWIASLQAAFAVGRDLTDYAIVVRGKGYIDGPSAGALFTAGIMSAMMGVNVRTDVTMTGTVNPDGTVGPVGGIPNKFQAAIKAGKKLLGYPIGQRFSMDYRTKKLVDLELLASRGGARAYEISTIYDAFQLLTGQTFPRPRPLEVRSMNLSHAMINIVRQRAAKWNRIFTKYKLLFRNAGISQNRKAVKKFVVAEEYMNKAVDFVREGSMATAYDFAQRGASHSFTSYWYGYFHKILFYNKGIHLNTLNKVLTTRLLNPVFKNLNKGLSVLKNKRPKTFGELMALISSMEQLIAAYSYAGDAQIHSTYAKNLIKNVMVLRAKKVPASTIIRAIYDNLKSSSFRVGLATLKVEKAYDFIHFKPAKSNRIYISHARLKQVNKIFLGAAQANLTYMDSILTKEIAKSRKMSVKKVKEMFMKKSNNYLQAVYSLRIPENYFSKKWGANNIGTLYAQIAGAMGSYFNSSMFLMKYYSLVIRKSKITGYVEAVKMQKALVNMLKNAELNARIHAALCVKEVGEVPTSAKIFYNIGKSMKEMQTALKIKSLEMFWRASMECQLAVLLTRQNKTAPKSIPAPQGNQGN
jgi:uncharacterized protein